jgi:integrase
LAGKILEGDLKPELTATWSDAVETYLAVNKQDKLREPLKEKKWEAKTRGLLEKFSKAFKGKSLPLAELDRGQIRLWLLGTYSNEGTRNRYINTFSAVINTWNRENPSKPVPNPFSGLANKQREQEQATKRLSFQPEQFDNFVKAIAAHKNDEIRLVGLLMAYTGCRTSEAAGLQCRDVKLDAEVPHVVFRTNKIRRMDKKGLERAVPVIEPLLSALKGFDRKGERDDPFFPTYGNTRGFDSVSVALRSTLTDAAGIVQ